MSIKKQKISPNMQQLNNSLSPGSVVSGTLLRGAFELSEAGAGRALVESIQFQLEGLFPRNKVISSPILRKSCALRLMQSCCTIDNMRIIRAKGLIKPLLKACSRLDNEDIIDIKLCFQILVLCLLRAETGSIIDDSEMPLETFESILRSSFMNNFVNQDNKIHNNNSNNISPNNNDSSKKVTDNPLHKKRKLSGKNINKTVISKNTPEDSIEFDEFEVDQKDSNRNKNNINNNDRNAINIFSEIDKVSPLLMNLLDTPNDTNNNEISKLLAVTIANRFMVSKVQSLARSSEQRGLIEASTVEELEGKILSLYQETLRKEIDNDSKSSFLYNLCAGMIPDLKVLNDIKKKDNENLSLDAIDVKSRIRLWQMLGLLEASCFRCSENQQYIGGILLNVDRGITKTMPIFLLDMLEALTKIVASQVKNSDESVLGDNKKSNGQDKNTSKKTPLKKEHLNSTPLKSTTPLKLDPSTEIERLRCLFPELPMFLSDCDSQIKPDLVVKVSSKELWLSVLRVLVNLTHKCPAACQALVESNCFDVFYSILALCTSWRGSIFQLEESLASKKMKGGGALSPQENPLERISFDASLYILTLLSNIYEAAPKTTLNRSKKLTDYYLDEILRKNKLDKFIMKESIVKKLSPNGKKNNTNDCDLFIQSIIQAENLLKIDNVGMMKCNKKQQADALQLLIAILGVEAEVFLKDIINTDDTIHESKLQISGDDSSSRVKTLEDSQANSNGSRSVSPEKKSSQKSNTPNNSQSSIKSNSSNKSKSIEGNSSTEIQEQLPVAELIIGAHVILLLHAIVYSSNDNEDEKYDIDDNDIEKRVRNALPRGSWWLGIRILKAFLALQGQTGLLLLESAIPVVAAIKRLELEDGIEDKKDVVKEVSPIKTKNNNNNNNNSNNKSNNNNNNNNNNSSSSSSSSSSIVISTEEIDWMSCDNANHNTNKTKKDDKNNDEENTKGKWIWDKTLNDFVWV